jgi:hypothetical protein
LDYHHYEGYQPQVDFSDDDKNTLYGMIQGDADDGGSGCQAKILLLKDEGYYAVLKQGRQPTISRRQQHKKMDTPVQ